jgi:general secretion pathway protein L
MGASAQVLAPVGAFFRWWGAELAGLVPARLRRISGSDEQLVLLLAEDGVAVSLETGRQGRALGRIDLGDPGAVSGRLDRLLRQRGIARGRLAVHVRLPAAEALRTTMELPAAAMTNLAEVVAFELDRYTPFRADQVYYSYRLLPRPSGDERFPVGVTVVPRSVVDDARRLCAALAIEPDGIDVEAAGADSRPSEPLRIGDAAATRAKAGSFLTYALFALAVVLAVIAVAVPLGAAHRKAALLSEDFAAAKKAVETAAALRAEIEALQEEQRFLIDRKRQVPSASMLLHDVTRILPDDTWLTELHLAGSEVQLSGVTESSSALIGLLERSGVVRNTVFRSPVTRDPTSGRERFGIAAQLSPERAP